EHRAVGANAEPMRRAMHLYPVLTGELLVGDRHPHTLAEDLGPATRKCVESCFAKSDQYLLDRHLVDARNVRDFYGGERLDVDVRIPRLESAEHLAVVL